MWQRHRLVGNGCGHKRHLPCQPRSAWDWRTAGRRPIAARSCSRKPRLWPWGPDGIWSPRAEMALGAGSRLSASLEPVSPGRSPDQSPLLHWPCASPGNSWRQWIVRPCSCVPDACPRPGRQRVDLQTARGGLGFRNSTGSVDHPPQRRTGNLWQSPALTGRTRPSGRARLSGQVFSCPPAKRPLLLHRPS